MTPINEITSAEWSLSLSGYGEVVQAQSDVNQCIQIILNTVKGSDPLRPTFGCDWWKFTDNPVSDAAPQMIREIVDSLKKWEQRIEVSKVDYLIEDGKINLNILWVLVGNQQKGISTISLDLQPEPPANALDPLPLLETPANLTANYDNPDGVLDWEFSDEAGIVFQIIRGENGGPKIQIGTASGVLTYTDPDLALDTNFQYQVRATRGSRSSDFSNEAEIETLQNILEFFASAPDNFSLTKTGTAAVVESAGGITKVFTIGGDPQNITAFYGDDGETEPATAGITGTLDLSGLSGMRTVRARNQSFTFVPGTWVQNASVSINLSNSITTSARVSALIDSIIIANGGTTTDDGSNYTGSAGNTFASRTLVIGTIELDLGDPLNTILYEKIVSLGTKGWTITTVTTLCDKQIDFNTGTKYWSVTYLKKTRKFYGIDYVSGSPLDMDLYDTQSNAVAGGATGRLAQGLTACNAWVLNDTNYNAWTTTENKYIRLYSSDVLSTNNKSNLRYQALPTTERPCGQVIDVLNISAFAAYSTRLLQIEWTGALLILRRSTDSQERAFFPNPNGTLRWVNADTASVGGRTQTVGGTGQPIAATVFNEETSSITTWIGAGTASVVAVCDQSGNGYHITTTSRPSLSLTHKAILATSSLNVLSYFIGAVPSWLSTSNVELTFIQRRKILVSSPIGGGSPSLASMIAIRNGDAGNTPLSYVINQSGSERYDIGKTGTTNVSVSSAPLNIGEWQIHAAARNSTIVDTYINGIINVPNTSIAGKNSYGGPSNYIIYVGNNLGANRGNINVPWSDTVIYKSKLPESEITLISNLLNS